MKTINKIIVSLLLLAGICGLNSCQSDHEVESDILPQQQEQKRTEHTAQLNMNITMTGFEGQTTRAVVGEWTDSSCVYLQFYNGSQRVNGIAKYSSATGQWTVTYYDEIAAGSQAKCEVYYFQNPINNTESTVTLSAASAVFADMEATYLFEDKTVTVTAHLTPQTGRLRFKGTSEAKFSFTGLMSFTSYNVFANAFTKEAQIPYLTVGADGYTPYVYGEVADDRNFFVFYDDDDYSYKKTFGSEVLAVGHSGFIDVPTIENRNGWIQILSKKEYIVSGVSFTMIMVKPGIFQMGKSADGSDVSPVHRVTLTKSYYMGETEVTQALWEAVMGSNPSYFMGADKPVERVSWNDCQTFITELNSLTGGSFRLPTEAEWEFATMGGVKSKGYTYSGSNTIGDVAWYTSNSKSTTHDVKTKAANELGFYDMSGNVYEWCQDWYSSYSTGAQTDPTGPTSGSSRVYRGGCLSSDATYSRVAYRGYSAPTKTNNNLGLRLASQ